MTLTSDRKLVLIASALALGLLLEARPAQAKLVEIWGSGLVGGATGSGRTGRDFYKWAGGGAAGFEVGARLLFIAAYLDYLRFFGGTTGANLVGLNLGSEGSITLSGKLALVLRGAGTFYLGSLNGATHTYNDQPVQSDHVQTRGVGLRGGIGLRYSFLKVLSVGVTPQIGYHYFFGGANEDPTKTELNSQGWDFQAMGYLRFALGI